jgi:hypothetical protein
MALSVRTDRKWKNFVIRYDVPKRVLASQFDYQDEDDAGDGFFKYHGVWYHLDQFMRMPNDSPLAGWDGYLNDSMSTGVVIKLSPDGEQYQAGTFAS